MISPKYGVLMVNLGTPHAPTTQAVKSYLAEFLSKRRLRDIPRLLWLPLLYGIILPLRSTRLAKNYQRIWMDNGSPLMVYSRRQQQALAINLPDVTVELAMIYGKPTLQQAIANLLVQNITWLVILPLFPQYSSATSGVLWDAVVRILTTYRRLPSISFIRDYAQHPAYIAALSTSIARHFLQYGQPDLLIMSFHGIPISYVKKGDDYPQRCKATYQSLTAALEYPAKKVMMTFQSRFGSDPWLLPATDKILKILPTKGINHVQVICPGFAADCLETLDEIQVKNKKIFLHAGGKLFQYIPALNDDVNHIALFQQLVMAELKL